MLQVRNACLDRAKEGLAPILDNVSFTIDKGEFAAVIGPSGCGKSTLLNCLAEVKCLDRGSVSICGLSGGEFKERSSIGFVRQFGAFHGSLSIREILQFALKLQAVEADLTSRIEWVSQVTGLGHLMEQRYSSLSGGERRRVALAEVLVLDPPLLLLDELTSGLDPHSDEEIMRWLAEFTQATGKTVILVTHNVQHLDSCSKLLVLKNGVLLFAGHPGDLLPSFGANRIEQIYSGECGPQRHVPTAGDVLWSAEELSRRSTSAISQISTLVRRLFTLFWRDKSSLFLQGLLVVSFPLLVAVFGADGLPNIRNLSLAISSNPVETLRETVAFQGESYGAASLVSGLAMFQVILLTLMGSNNTAREIAREREIIDKERHAGVHPRGILASKWLLAFLLSLLQAGVMTLLVKQVCGFPGSAGAQFFILFLTTMAMSSICLAISSLTSSPERASLLSVYLVGLQLPLSGAVLAMPDWLVWITRPFISAYWGWSGYLQTLKESAHYDIIAQVSETSLADYPLSVLVLSAQIILSLGIAGYGLSRERGHE